MRNEMSMLKETLLSMSNNETIGEHTLKRGKKVENNFDLVETANMAKLFSAAFGIGFTPYDYNAYGATHLESVIPDQLEIFFDTNKFKVCFGDALIDIIPIQQFIECGFVYTRKTNWKCKNLLEHRYGGEQDFNITVADVVIILWDCLIPQVEKPTTKPAKRRSRKKNESGVKAS